MLIRSIFLSLDGEVNYYHQGGFTTFIRFAGCNFNGHDKHCKYCDTKYAQSFDSGTEMSVEDVISEVKHIGCKKVTITGGEPCAQMDALIELTSELDNKGFVISLETNGSYDPTGLSDVGSIIMDWKLSNAGVVSEYMDAINFINLDSNWDFVKFVIGNMEDYIEAKRVCTMLRTEGCTAKFAYSPSFGLLEPSVLFDWLKADKLYSVILNLQMHKAIWPNVAEGEEH